jgi:heme exporter protein D
MQPMCGFSGFCWVSGLATLVLFAALVVASVVFLVRSFGSRRDGSEEREKD